MNEVKAFFAGCMLGAILLLSILIIFDQTPISQLKKDRQEAVNHGAATWIANTNGDVIFQWNINR